MRELAASLRVVAFACAAIVAASARADDLLDVYRLARANDPGARLRRRRRDAPARTTSPTRRARRCCREAPRPRPPATSVGDRRGAADLRHRRARLSEASRSRVTGQVDLRRRPAVEPARRARDRRRPGRDIPRRATDAVPARGHRVLRRAARRRFARHRAGQRGRVRAAGRADAAALQGRARRAGRRRPVARLPVARARQHDRGAAGAPRRAGPHRRDHRSRAGPAQEPARRPAAGAAPTPAEPQAWVDTRAARQPRAVGRAARRRRGRQRDRRGARRPPAEPQRRRRPRRVRPASRKATAAAGWPAPWR